MTVTYIKKGIPHDFKRIDTVKTIHLHKTWKQGGLLYGYKNQFEVVSIAMEDIIDIVE
jgi:hypothetical protein